MDMAQSVIERVVVAVAAKLLPGSFKGKLDLTLPSGRLVTLGGTIPGEIADLKLRNFKVLWASLRRQEASKNVLIKRNCLSEFSTAS